MMRIALDCWPAAYPHPSGIGRYVQQLMHSFASMSETDEQLQFLFLVPAKLVASAKDWPQSANAQTVPYTRGLFAPLLGLRHRADVLLTTQSWIPRLPGVPMVSTIHDLHLIHGINPGDAESKDGVRRVAALREMARRSKRLIAISQHVRSDMMATLKVAADRIRVVPQCLDPLFVQPISHAAIEGLPQRPFFLISAENRASKNFARTVAGYAQSGMAESHDLVITGNSDSEIQRKLDAEWEKAGLAKHIHWLGYRPYSELPSIFARAAGLLFASLDEGFGYPIIEAMAVGTPVLTSNITSCPEVAGGHAVLIDPYSLDDIAEGIRRLPTLSAAWRKAARRHAHSFTPERTAEATLAVLREVALKPH